LFLLFFSIKILKFQRLKKGKEEEKKKKKKRRKEKRKEEEQREEGTNISLSFLLFLRKERTFNIRAVPVLTWFLL
jgi:hypothetical protein